MSDIAAATNGTASTSTGPVQRAIRHASRETGVRFDFLLDQAQRESGLRPEVRATTSSATGLYQFVEQTWLRLVAEQGPRHGMAREAAAIGFDGQRYGVDDPGERRRILGLRLDPTANALMAGEYARENHTKIESALARPSTKADLAIAHFLGGDGAVRFLRALEQDSTRPAAPLFPAAAEANRSVFYDARGTQRSLDDLYRRFAAQDAELPSAGAPSRGLGHFMAAVPEGRAGAMLSAPILEPGEDLWQVLTHPSNR